MDVQPGFVVWEEGPLVGGCDLGVDLREFCSPGCDVVEFRDGGYEFEVSNAPLQV